MATKTQNAIADLISVPLQNNINFGVGHMDDVLPNIQVGIPFRLTDECNVITRTTSPVIYPPELAPGVGEGVGFGDMQLSRVLLPSKPGAIIWGASAILQGPTATDDALGKWGALPTVLALTIQGPGVVGALANNVGSFAGDSMRKDVNQIVSQPLVNYDLPTDCHVNSVPITTADWKADADHRWTLSTDATLLDRPVPAASAPGSVVPPATGEPGDLEDYDPWEEFNAKSSR